MAKINRNEKHQKYQKMLNSKRWKQLRMWKLNKNPLCELCEKKGLVVSAIDVHHIKPVEKCADQEMEHRCFNPNNLISLCIECHIEVHRQMRSHEGQMENVMPKEDPEPISNEDAKLNEWLNKNRNPDYVPKRKVRKGIRKTKYGWVTMEEYHQKQQEELDAWANELKRRVNTIENGAKPEGTTANS